MQPFPSLAGKWQISMDGGGSPRWARNGRGPFFRDGDAMDVKTSPTFRAGTPKVLFEDTYANSPSPLQPGIPYDVSPEGRRVLMLKLVSGEDEVTELEVVENWFEELRCRVLTSFR